MVGFLKTTLKVKYPELLNQDTEKERNKKVEKAVHDNLYNKGFRDGLAVLDKIFCIVHPLSIMSTPELEHKAIMQIAEMLEPFCLTESGADHG